MQTAT